MDEVSYTYDHAMRRVSKTTDDGTTLYPTLDYSVEDSTTTVYVYGSSGLVASVKDDGTTSTTSTIHTDHLGSTSVVTDEDGIMIELLDYNPYGTERISWSSSSSDGEAETQKTYIGEYSDQETDLSYLNARYYDPDRGQFLSQDSVYLSLGSGTDKREQVILLDPQMMNSYSYGRGNPATRIDPSGESSLSAWLRSPRFTGTQVVFGKFGAAILGLSGRPASAQLFGHSFNLNPGDVYAGNGSAVVNSILDANAYTSVLDQKLNDHPGGGDFILEFNPQTGDAKTATGKMTLNVTATPSDNGAFQVTTRGTDTYNFGFNNGDYTNLLGSATNMAYLSQTTGAISNFEVHVEFNHEYTPAQQNENKNYDGN